MKFNLFTLILCSRQLAVSSQVLSCSTPAIFFPDDRATNDRFGYSVSLHGDKALIGSIFDDDNGSSSGSAYVLVNNGGWTLESKLNANDGTPDDRFGHSVSLYENRALIGAIGDESAYIFVFNDAWELENKLVPSNRTDNYLFGYSVSLYDNWALIGAIGEEDNGPISGAAYVFLNNGGWSQEDKLLAFDGAQNDRFGWSVSLFDNRALISARSDDIGRGSVYVYMYNNSWMFEEKLTPSDGVDQDQFGYSVSLYKNRALIGALFHDTDGISNAGAAYLFVNNGGWRQEIKLSADIPAQNDRFGESVSLYQNRALIGALGVSDVGSNAGAAYTFINSNGWTFESKLAVDGGTAGDQFGNSVSQYENTSLIGARFTDIDFTNSGAVYFTECPFIPTAFPTMSPTANPTLGPSTSPTQSPTESPNKKSSKSSKQRKW